MGCLAGIVAWPYRPVYALARGLDDGLPYLPKRPSRLANLVFACGSRLANLVFACGSKSVCSFSARRAEKLHTIEKESTAVNNKIADELAFLI
jgi:hypothetical protein